MVNSPVRADFKPLSLWAAVGFALLAVTAFHLAYGFAAVNFLIAVYLFGLFELTRLATAKQASYLGLAVGMLIFAPQMGFLWTIFGPAAVALWFVLAFWIRLFLVLGRWVRLRFGAGVAALLLPLLWTGLEYFRSEMYYLRFTWFNEGYVFAGHRGWLPMALVGMYGCGFVLMAAIALLSRLTGARRLVASLIGLVSLAGLVNLPLPAPVDSRPAAPNSSVVVAGLQLEFPTEPEVVFKLDQLIKAHPEAQLLVLSEYTIPGPLPERMKAWCRQRQKYLIVGAEAMLPDDQYYNTAFVIGPQGDVLFQQAKSVPIQFFKDGRPAAAQTLWNSPWGRIGLCICYDLSYRQVTDELVRQGAQALIVPTMGVATWGAHQHALHARVAPLRAAEYGIPIFRLASSGISQVVNPRGEVLATAPFLGDSATIVGTLTLGPAGTRPRDRLLVQLAVGITVLLTGWCVVDGVRRSRQNRRKKHVVATKN